MDKKKWLPSKTKFVRDYGIYPLERRILRSAVLHLSATAENAKFVEGTQATIEVASISALPTTESLSDLTAKITWGDKTTSQGTLADSGNAVIISGTHTYGEGGSYKFVVHVSGTGVKTASVKGLASTSYVPLVVDATSLGAVSKASTSFTVGSFTDPAGLDKASFYRAEVFWGDGTKSPGKLSPDASGGYAVAAAHRYKLAGLYDTVLDVTDRTAPPVSATATSSVADTVDRQSSMVDQSGATIDTPDGSDVSVPDDVFDTPVVADVDDLSTATDVPDSNDISPVGQAVEVDFGSPDTRSTETEPAAPNADSDDIDVDIDEGTEATEDLTDSLPFVTITPPSGSPIQLVLDTETESGSEVETSLPVSTLEQFVPAAELTKTKLQFGLIEANSEAAVVSSTITYGAKYFDPSILATNPSADPYQPFPQDGLPQGWNASSRTLVLVHGVRSSVETAFPANVVNQIAQQGGYINSAGIPQVIGFNYDWTKDPATSGAELASFLNQLKREPDVDGNTIQDVDIEGHSNGTIVALSAASQTTMDVDNLLLLGGPLDGTPAANFLLAGANLLATSLLNAVDLPEIAEVFDQPVTTATSIFGLNGPALEVDSPELQTIRADFIQEDPDTHIFTAAGSNPNFAGNGAFGTAYNVLDSAVFAGQPNDGIIPVSSASGTDPSGNPLFPNQLTSVGVYNVIHTDIEGDTEIITAVSSAVNAHRPSIDVDEPNVDLGSNVSGQALSTDIVFGLSGAANTFSDYRVDLEAASGSAPDVEAAIADGDISIDGSTTGKTLQVGPDQSIALDIDSDNLVGNFPFDVDIYAPASTTSPVVIPVAADFVPVLTITAETHVILPQQTVSLSVAETDGAGNPVSFDPSDLTYASEDDSTATVDDGTITGIAYGTTTITVSDSTNGASGDFVVIVSNINLTMEQDSVSVGQGSQVQLTVDATDDNGNPIPEDYLDLQWSSEENSVATVDQSSGLVTGIANGNTSIIVTDVTPGIDASASTQVQVLGLVHIVLGPDNPTATYGDPPLQLVAAPQDVNNDPVTLPPGELLWATDQPDVATVSQDGVVTVVGAGTVTITVTDPPTGIQTSISVNVVGPLDHIDVQAPAGTLEYGDAPIQLTAQPRDKVGNSVSLPAGDELVWTSSDPSIATVDQNGNVTALAPGGTVTITVTDKASGIASAPVSLTVLGEVANISLGIADSDIQTGDTTTVVVTATDSAGNVLPSSVTSRFQYTSSDGTVVTVSASGVVTAVGAGSAQIQAIDPHTNVTSNVVAVTVSDPFDDSFNDGFGDSPFSDGFSDTPFSDGFSDAPFNDGFSDAPFSDGFSDHSDFADHSDS